jgi:cytochrome c biogenesis protein CcmG/thiol:disulfide interchange protein DsbE
MKRYIYLIPLTIFLLLVVFLGFGLTRDPREVPSPLINKPAPAFKLAQLHEPSKTFSPAEMRGKVWLLNVWASWCVSCREEHPVLLDASRFGTLPIYGLNYKDRPEDATAWLNELGNPYILSARDSDGRVGIDYGVYGVPETYLVDGDGIIRFKQIGPVTPQVLEQKILPLYRELTKH